MRKAKTFSQLDVWKAIIRSLLVEHVAARSFSLSYFKGKIMFMEPKIIKLIMLSLLAPILWILLVAGDPYLVIESWGLLITGSSILTLGYALTLLRQLFKEYKNGKHINIIYILWLMSILYVLVQIPYYYFADLRESYERLHEGSDQEWWEDVGCLMWYDNSCGRGKNCLKWEGGKCVVLRRKEGPRRLD